MLNEIPFGWYFGLAPIALQQEVVTPEQASLIFSGPKFFVALLAGVTMAFAFQLLITNFSVAFGITSWGTDEDIDSLGGTLRRIGTGVGLTSLLGGAFALFAACFLAVKLSLVESALLGGIIGVVIWSTYFSLLMWFGSSTIGSVVGSVFSTATSGFQGLLGTATTAMGADITKKQLVASAEEITAAVRRELTSSFDPESIKNTLQASLSSVKLPKLDGKELRKEFDKFLKDADVDRDLLSNINRETFVDLLKNNTEFSEQDITRIAEQLETVWKQSLSQKNPTEQVIDLLKKATPEDLNSENLGERLQELVKAGVGNGKSNGMMKQVVQYGVGAALPTVLDKIDFSEVDIKKVRGQLQKLTEKVKDIDVEKITNQLQQLKATPNNTIKADVEEYISNSFPWHFNRITLKDEFKEILYDPNANTKTVLKQLQELNQEDLTNLLKSRGDLTEVKIKEIVEIMESVRTEVLETVQQQGSREEGLSLRQKIDNYLNSTGKEQLSIENIKQNFAKLLEDPQASFEDLSSRLSHFNRDTLVEILQKRQDLSQEEANNIVNQLEQTRDDVLNKAQQLQEQATAKAQELQQRVEEYLRNTNKEELNPEGIKRDFQTLLEDPQAGLYALKDRASQFDRETLVQLLSQRQDLSEEQVNQILDNLIEVRDSILQAPQKVKQQYDQAINAIADYLRNTNKEELNPEGMRRDLEKLLQDPKQGALALKSRFDEIDRETLVTLLTQRGDLSEEQVNQIIDSVQQTVQKIVKAPQRLANRVSKQALDFEATLENYLRNTNKEELNPEGIKRDLQLLLKDPRLGVGNLGSRISKIDRSTLVALLSQREDISEAEINQIIDQIESARDSITEQIHQFQERLQSLNARIFGRIRDYLNSLDREELNYEGIQQDFAKLFDDPQLGFEALQNRLGQFDRDTLVAILSSREDISPEQANQIINRIEAARDSVLHQAKRIQEETQKRLSDIKHQAQKQALETKKVVGLAAWWLFGTAFTSLAASALAGVIAVNGFDFLG